MIFLWEKLTTLFPNLKGKEFEIFWDDYEGDRVTIHTDEELKIALTELEGPSFVVKMENKEKSDVVKAALDGNHAFYWRWIRSLIRTIYNILGIY